MTELTNYTAELAALDRECETCRCEAHAWNVEYTYHAQLKRWRLVTAEGIAFKRAVRARLAQLEADWPVGTERMLGYLRVSVARAVGYGKIFLTRLNRVKHFPDRQVRGGSKRQPG